MHDERTALLPLILLRSDGSAPISQHISFEEVGFPMKTEIEVREPARERSVAMQHAKRLLTSQCFSYLLALLASSTLYTLNDDKLLAWNAVNQLQFTATAFPFDFASLSAEAVHPLQIKTPVKKRPGVIDWATKREPWVVQEQQLSGALHSRTSLASVQSSSAAT